MIPLIPSHIAVFILFEMFILVVSLIPATGNPKTGTYAIYWPKYFVFVLGFHVFFYLIYSAAVGV